MRKERQTTCSKRLKTFARAVEPRSGRCAHGRSPYTTVGVGIGGVVIGLITKERTMNTNGMHDKVAGKAKELAGQAKEKIGKATGNKETVRKGAEMQVEGKVQEAVGKGKAAIGKAADAVKKATR